MTDTTDKLKGWQKALEDMDKLADNPTFTGRLTFPATDTTDIVQRLQVCGQYTYHDEAILYGTVDALRRLRQVLDDAIDKGEGSAHFVPSDGECYQVLAFVRSDAEMDAIKPEYSFLIENSLQAIENDTLRARIAELQAEKQAAALAHVSLFGELQTALEKQDELEKVAARYRWLRNEAGAMSVFTAAYWNTTTAEQLDAAIDAAMGS